MDPSDFRPSPRRELALQGPRPARLKLNKSHVIKKPPVAPPPRSTFRPAPAAAPPQPQPLILYAVSPKIIYTKPNNFMTLVQRLTGPDSTADTSVADLSLPSPASGGGALSPAARIATFEKSSSSSYHHVDRSLVDELIQIDGSGMMLDRPALRPGILSPLPVSLPSISPALFSPSFDPSILSFIPELSPAAFMNNNNNSCGMITSSGNNNNINGVGLWDGGNLLGSPGNSLLMTPLMPSPGAWGEFFSQFPDL